MRALILGAVESTRVALRTISGAPGWSVGAVMTLPPDLARRHSDFVDLAADSRAAGARLIHAADSNAPDAVAAITGMNMDAVFVIGWSQICRAPFREAAGGHVIGYHPAPLPRLRGRAALPWTILLAEPITAGTLFWIDDGIDSGAILAQRFFHVAPDETVASLYDRHLAVLETLLGDALSGIAAGAAPRRRQDERYATYAAKRTPDDGVIDWTRPAAEVARLVRAVGRPYPGAFTTCRGERVAIWSATPEPAGPHAAASPGQVVAIGPEGFTVRCGCGGTLRVEEWESASARPPFAGMRLGSA